MLTIVAEFEIIGKPEPRPYFDSNNKQAFSYKLNVGQNEGMDMATLSTNERVYSQVRRGDKALFECTVAEYGEKTVFRVMEVKEFLNFPAAQPSGQPIPGAAPSPVPTPVPAPGGGKK